ncbi:aldehyde:ferredoxin oxidoreductase [candidate division KSB1 bacterium]|nr:MAG: aldehyde:ferredoxin oxidoreductase [candidate division KSB1 bacterium]
MFGYTGKRLIIDLTEHTYKVENIEESLLLSSIGGRGLNSVTLFNRLKPQTEPLSPESILLFGIGPLTGTCLPASARFTVSGKSPLTGILGDGNAGGHWASELKFAGFDQISISGKSNKWIYLFIFNGKVEFRNAEYLKGKDIFETTTLIRKELKDNSIQISAIGPASENLVKFGSISCNLTRIAARTGMGTIMGSKKLKAIALKGDIPVKIKHPDKFLKLSQLLDKKIESHPEFGRRKKMGTTMLISQLNKIGILPTNHFQNGINDYSDKISGETLSEKFNVKNKACFNCNLPCSRYFFTGEVEGEGPEYETLCGFTSRIGQKDLHFALKMNDYVNRMGLDSITLTEIIGWAMECIQKGILSFSDFDNLNLVWGNKKAIFELTRKIVYREGVGDILAEGVKKASEYFGKDSEKLALHVKGLEIICGDPRGIKGYGLTYAISSRGADHLRAEPFFELTCNKKEAKKRFGYEEAADRLEETGKPELVNYTEKIALLCDSITMCKNIGLCMDILDIQTCAELLNYGTGLNFNPSKLYETAEHIINIEREFNLREGLKPEEDTLPERFIKEPLKNGKSAGHTVNIKKMVDRYYEIKGWKK